MLDGLRGIAAIAVMLFHAEVMFDALGAFSRGYLFVDFFFLLSGFVLTLAADGKMRSGQIGAWAFLWSRVVRLWPTITVGIVFGAAAAGITGNIEGLPMLVGMGLVMLPVLSGGGQIFPLNGPQWSIMLELLANVAHATVLHRLHNRWLLALVAVAGLALCLTTTSFGSNTLGPFSFNWWLALPRVVYSYGLGIWLSRRWASGEHPRLVSWRIAMVLPVAAIVVLNALPISIAVGDLTVTLALFPCLFWLAVTTDTPAEARVWLGRLGALSFPLYAVHVPIFAVFVRFGGSPAVMASAIGGTLIAACCITVLLSPRGLRCWLVRRSSPLSLPA